MRSNAKGLFIPPLVGGISKLASTSSLNYVQFLQLVTNVFHDAKVAGNGNSPS